MSIDLVEELAKKKYRDFQLNSPEDDYLESRGWDKISEPQRQLFRKMVECEELPIIELWLDSVGHPELKEKLGDK